MELTASEERVILRLRELPETYSDGYLLIHLSPVNDTHIIRIMRGKPAPLGKLSRMFYNAFIELKKWFGINQTTFLVTMSEDYLQLFDFNYYPHQNDSL